MLCYFTIFSVQIQIGFSLGWRQASDGNWASNKATYSNNVVADIYCTRSSAIAEGPRDESCQLKFCQLQRNNAETTCTTSPELIEVMKLEGYSKLMCSEHVHTTITRSSRFHCLIGVINKPTTVELFISLVYRRLAVAKFSKSTM